MRKLMMIAMLALSSLCLYAERVESKPLELLLDIEESSNISIGFAKEAVTSLDQQVAAASGTVELATSLATLTASLSEPIYVYAQIISGSPCSLAISSSSMTGNGGERLGWDIGTDGLSWLSLEEDDSSESYMILEHDGDNLTEVYCAPLSVVTHSFDGKQSSGFSGTITLIISDGLEGGSV